MREWSGGTQCKAHGFTDRGYGTPACLDELFKSVGKESRETGIVVL